MKVVLHVHSRWSYDGVWDLGAIARLYGRLGVGAVLMTEHDTGFDPNSFDDYRAACRAASTSRCELVPGIEYSSPDNAIHLLTWGMDHFLAEHQPVAQTLERVRTGGGVSVFAHPARKAAFQMFDPAWSPYLAGIELWNRKADGLSYGKEAAELLAQTGLPATVGQDFHRLKQLYPLTMELAGPTPAIGMRGAAVIAALREGRLQPRAFGRPLVDDANALRSGLHPSMEAARRRLKRLLGR